MVYGIKISDKSGGLVAVSLQDIIIHLEGEGLCWAILYLWATGDLGAGRSMVELEEAILKSPRGFAIGWDELKRLSKKLDQVMDVVLVGSNEPDKLHRYSDDGNMYAACDYVIEMVDSSYWLVHAHDESVIKKLAGCFREVEQA